MLDFAVRGGSLFVISSSEGTRVRRRGFGGMSLAMLKGDTWQ